MRKGRVEGEGTLEMISVCAHMYTKDWKLSCTMVYLHWPIVENKGDVYQDVFDETHIPVAVCSVTNNLTPNTSCFYVYCESHFFASNLWLHLLSLIPRLSPTVRFCYSIHGDN